jgi:hypothetical protein
MKQKREPRATSQRAGRPICPKCLEPLVADEHFCARCGAPLTVQATANPYDQIQAEGYVYREGSRHPDKPIVVAGMWLLWGPCLLALVAVDIYVVVNIRSIIREARQMWSFGEYAIITAIAGACAFGQWVSGVILFRTTRNYLRRDVERRSSEDSAAARGTSGPSRFES